MDRTCCSTTVCTEVVRQTTSQYSPTWTRILFPSMWVQNSQYSNFTIFKIFTDMGENIVPVNASQTSQYSNFTIFKIFTDMDENIVPVNVSSVQTFFTIFTDMDKNNIIPVNMSQTFHLELWSKTQDMDLAELLKTQNARVAGWRVLNR